MKVSIDEGGACRRILHVDVPADDVRPEYEQVLREFTAVSAVPGFRKGRAPLSVIEARYARPIAEEVQQRLVPRYYRQAFEEQNVRPVAIIDVKDVRFGKAEGLAFAVTVDVAPDFNLPSYKQIPLEAQPVTIDEGRVDTTLTRVRENYARWQDVSGRAVQQGDLALIDYRGELDGKPLQDAAPAAGGVAEGKDFWALVGEPEFIPGLATGLAGMTSGETRTSDVTFPEAYHVETVRGRTVRYVVTLKGIRERVMPEMTEDFLKRFDVKTEAELRDKIREDLKRAGEETENQRLRNEIARFLLEHTAFDLPESVVEQETSLTIRGIVRRSMMQGATREQVEEHRKDILDTATRSSRDRVRLAYILSRIADTEDIQVADDAVDRRIEAMAQQYRMTVEQLRAELDKREAMTALRSELREEKTLDHLLQNAKIKT